jgi:hypothetical protein
MVEIICFLFVAAVFYVTVFFVVLALLIAQD